METALQAGRDTIEAIDSREALPGSVRRIAAAVRSRLVTRDDPEAIAAGVAELGDALLRRVLALAERELGPPPTPFAWLALGSSGRGEPTPLADQDHLLVHAAGDEAGNAWFAALAARASDDLAAAGVPRCPGGWMATGWCGTVPEWVERLQDWAEDGGPEALLDAAVLMDLRPVAGALDVAPLTAAAARLAAHPAVLRGLVRCALQFRTRGRLALRLHGRRARVDLKAHGLAPLTLLARCWGAEARSPARATAARLEAARDAGLLEPGPCAAACEAHRVLLGLRLTREADALAEDRPASTELLLGELDRPRRAQLLDALHAVHELRRIAAFHFRVEA
ncbi:MAG: DUF294 nucleotidyltransferase-like domain-containing protein [Anaeromyxobacter sp.]